MRVCRKNSYPLTNRYALDSTEQLQNRDIDTSETEEPALRNPSSNPRINPILVPMRQLILQTNVMAAIDVQIREGTEHSLRLLAHWRFI